LIDYFLDNISSSLNLTNKFVSQLFNLGAQFCVTMASAVRVHFRAVREDLSHDVCDVFKIDVLTVLLLFCCFLKELHPSHHKAQATKITAPEFKKKFSNFDDLWLCRQKLNTELRP